MLRPRDKSHVGPIPVAIAPRSRRDGSWRRSAAGFRFLCSTAPAPRGAGSTRAVRLIVTVYAHDVRGLGVAWHRRSLGGLPAFRYVHAGGLSTKGPRGEDAEHEHGGADPPSAAAEDHQENPDRHEVGGERAEQLAGVSRKRLTPST